MAWVGIWASEGASPKAILSHHWLHLVAQPLRANNPSVKRKGPTGYFCITTHQSLRPDLEQSLWCVFKRWKEIGSNVSEGILTVTHPVASNSWHEVVGRRSDFAFNLEIARTGCGFRRIELQCWLNCEHSIWGPNMHLSGAFCLLCTANSRQ